MTRYQECDDSLLEIFFKVLEEDFAVYQNLKFKVLVDSKIRIAKGKLVLASIEVPGEKLKFFSRDNIATEGYDYIFIINQKAFDIATETDRKRLIRHELQHIFIDDDDKCKLVGHEIEDFYEEIERNADDPRWAEILADKVTMEYEEEKSKK